MKRRTETLLLLPVCLWILLPGPAPAQSVPLEAYRAGAAAVDRAAHALATGGVAPNELETLGMWITGANLQRFQSPSPEPPFDTLRSEEQMAFEPGTDRVGIEFRAWWPSFVRHVSQVAGPAGGAIEDFNTGRTQFDPGLTPDRLSSLRHRIPHLVVRDALDRRASIRHLGVTVFDGQEAEVVSYLQPDGETGTLYLSGDPDRPVLAHEILTSDLRFGDTPRTTTYADYTAFDGVLLPATVRVLRGGVEETRLRLDSASVAAPVAAEALALLDRVQPEAAHTDRRPTHPVVPVEPAPLDTIAPGVYLVAPPQAPNYRMLFVESDDGLVAIEAPESVEATAAAIAAIHDALGPLPILYAGITHHHSDHSGGIGAFARHGATLITTPGNVSFVQDLVVAPRSLEGHEGPVANPTIRMVRDSIVIATNAGPLVLVDVGPHPHAAEHLVALLPEVGLVFQGDLVQFPHDGSVEAARPQTFALVELIDRLPWPVRQIAGVHGRVGTPDDLAAAVQAARETDQGSLQSDIVSSIH